MYHTSLDRNEIVIELNDKDLGDSGFELLSKIKFKNLQKLNVKGNNITNIAPLSCLCNKNTKKLDLSFNKLNNISPLGQQNFNLKGVRKLLLNDNLIEDIGVFQMEDVFPNLKKLNLCNNRINFALKDTQQTLEKLKERLLELNYNNFSNNNTPDSMISNYSSNLTKIEDIEFLNERFKLKNPEISKINYILLYRGTRDGDRAKDFHDKVRGISKTLCVIRTPKGLFGGYTEATWDGDNCDKFDENAFCF
jgi:Leucine-rich repeat (LRR) protein